MLTITIWSQYKNLIQKIGGKFENYTDQYWLKWYDQYCYYEKNWWVNYFDSIFLTALRKSKKNVKIQFFLWESCPGDMPFPHPNYAFDVNRFNQMIDGTRDKYLKEISNYNDVTQKSVKSNKTIEVVLNELAKNGIIIVDIYPTHGIRLETEQRKRLFQALFEEYSLTKLSKITDCISKNGINIKKSSIIYCSKEIFDAGFDKIKRGTKQKILDVIGKKRLSIKLMKTSP
jgi:hypothetical protein